MSNAKVGVTIALVLLALFLFSTLRVTPSSSSSSSSLHGSDASSSSSSVLSFDNSLSAASKTSSNKNKKQQRSSSSSKTPPPIGAVEELVCTNDGDWIVDRVFSKNNINDEPEQQEQEPALDDGISDKKNGNNNKEQSSSPKTLQAAISKAATSTSARSEDARRYANFMIGTSFLFRQWKPWAPLLSYAAPWAENAENTFESPARIRRRLEEANWFSSAHDGNMEMLFRVNNFCLWPFGRRMCGLNAEDLKKTFMYRDDSRGKLGPRHLDPRYVDFLNNPEDCEGSKSKMKKRGGGGGDSASSAPPLVFDERPVIFFPISAVTRWNTAHMTHRVLSLLRVVDMVSNPPQQQPANKEDLDQADQQQQQQQQQQSASKREKEEQQQPKHQPLLVLVDESTEDFSSQQTLLGRRTPVFAFFLRIIDLPWAVVGQDLTEDYVATMSTTTNHPLQSQEKRADFAAESGSQSGRGSSVCFKTGVAWGNCFHCTSDETQSYSFGLWIPPASVRPMHFTLLMEYRTRVRRCLGMIAPQARGADEAEGNKKTIESALGGGGGQQQQQQSSDDGVVRIFFDTRSWGSRKIRSLNRFKAGIAEDVAAMSSSTNNKQKTQLIFAEQWSPRLTRADYLRLVMKSRVFVGFHGAAFSGISLMPARSVVVELTTQHFRKDWFSTIAGLLNHAQIFAEVGHANRASYFVPPHQLMRLIQEGVSTLAERKRNSSIVAPRIMSQFVNERAKFAPAVVEFFVAASGLPVTSPAAAQIADAFKGMFDMEDDAVKSTRFIALLENLDSSNDAQNKTLLLQQEQRRQFWRDLVATFVGDSPVLFVGEDSGEDTSACASDMKGEERSLSVLACLDAGEFLLKKEECNTIVNKGAGGCNVVEALKACKSCLFVSRKIA